MIWGSEGNAMFFGSEGNAASNVVLCQKKFTIDLTLRKIIVPPPSLTRDGSMIYGGETEGISLYMGLEKKIIIHLCAVYKLLQEIILIPILKLS